MGRCKCDFCSASAEYVSGDGQLHLCEDCYSLMEDDFSCSFEDEVGMPFDEYYEMEEINNDY